MTQNLTPTRCRRRRTELGLTQSAVCAAAKLSHPSIISNYENERLTLADWQEAQLTEALGLIRDDVREPMRTTVPAEVAP